MCESERHMPDANVALKSFESTLYPVLNPSVPGQGIWFPREAFLCHFIWREIELSRCSNQSSPQSGELMITEDLISSWLHARSSKKAARDHNAASLLPLGHKKSYTQNAKAAVLRSLRFLRAKISKPRGGARVLDIPTSWYPYCRIWIARNCSRFKFQAKDYSYSLPSCHKNTPKNFTSDSLPYNHLKGQGSSHSKSSK